MGGGVGADPPLVVARRGGGGGGAGFLAAGALKDCSIGRLGGTRRSAGGLCTLSLSESDDFRAGTSRSSSSSSPLKPPPESN
ncbi:hypothetical protein POSPLADRAFT_1041807 [Postia placenta MAD-698-R-SB12]|uniref:Uncharacterized protein n=1 Tax=Postia placenta MAD-698-R-SB12 TaxID=670580 RepID=A0A1X6MLL5_9APHY|nr:hypothetical protein POSPLADRAFT_1041807 [Postia placenta MAD-698-R-SB12]OSX56973.1 hypothetical protein POSPLADRAFT_1041807 [Postia placenta MAD-698-R-SB12]